ncbi:hypothetical protein BDZ88DRAFT_276005 [Geranomyces variabilis]|nr:hypothetical protein BDZ88DRAFT_276005 [Geranomyces variabilis]KAJ3138598.1 hypothetical protein HDU90_001040 [Geranomyces variabilis]
MAAHRRNLAATLSSIFDVDDPAGEELGERIAADFKAKVKKHRQAAASTPRETEENAVTGSRSDTRPLYERLFSLTDADAGERVGDQPLLSFNEKLISPAVVAARQQRAMECMPSAANHRPPLTNDTPEPVAKKLRLSAIYATAEVTREQQTALPGIAAPANHRPPLTDAAPVPVTKKPRLSATRTRIAADTTPRASASASASAKPTPKTYKVSQPKSDPLCVSVEEPRILSLPSDPPDPASPFVIPLAERIKTNRRNVAASARFSPEIEPKVKRNSGRRKGKKQIETGLAEDEYEVESILSVRLVDDPHICHIRPTDPGPKIYLVRWRGYPSPTDNTWEPEENLTGATGCMKDFWQRRWAAERLWARLGLVALAMAKLKQGLKRNDSRDMASAQPDQINGGHWNSA